MTAAVQPDCAHCGMPITGYASVDGDAVCHPDSGLDCYRLITVYHHDMPCELPACVGSVRMRRRRELARIQRHPDEDDWA